MSPSVRRFMGRRAAVHDRRHLARPPSRHAALTTREPAPLRASWVGRACVGAVGFAVEALYYILLATGVGALVFLLAGGAVADDGEDGHGNG